MNATTDLEDKIAVERAALLRAGEHIVNGHIRLRRQCDLVYEMRLRKLDTQHAERLVQLLRATLEQWELHRTMVVEHLAYLEGQRRYSKQSLRQHILSGGAREIPR